MILLWWGGNPLREVGIFLETLFRYDAIGNDTLALYRAFQSRPGYHCTIFTANSDGQTEYIRPMNEGNSLLRQKNSIALLQYGGKTDAFDRVRKSRGLRIFRYHNITPPEFFRDFDPLAEQICREGRTRLKKGIEDFDFFWNASPYNETELLAGIGPDRRSAKERMRVLPPFHSIGESRFLEKPSLQEPAGLPLLLNVGRLVPNKNHPFLIATHAALLRMGTKTELILAGKVSSLRYRKALENLIQNYGTESLVHFYSEGLSEAELGNLYRKSTLFLSASLHEGFCVPLVEAMYFEKPILALAGSGVSDTLGNGGILLDRKDPVYFASILQEILLEKKARNHFARISRERFLSFTTEEILKQFHKLVDELEAWSGKK